MAAETGVSDWIVKARKRWPRTFKAKEIYSDGQYAVLTCAFLHPSAGQIMYSEVYLFETAEEATNFKSGLDISQAGRYCHAQTKGLCSRNHEFFDLLTMKQIQR